eukprot:TRINITY_DN3256_c0_g1_i2.p1 TRINITY_DN3256_c0_g1~~TRINITY_DN3256_c0_g1_i2.p1  ORF type:complete len:591 (-),score=75.68 TRINITY_DN3256_c0_g1_i2:358-2130(-)
MDKICRGSSIGDALNHGSYAEKVPHTDTSRTARGTHITSCSYKLENTEGGLGGHPRTGFTSDTFRSQNWFKHTPVGITNAMASQLSPRGLRGRGACPGAHPSQIASPSPEMRHAGGGRSASSKSAVNLPEPRGREQADIFSGDSADRGGMRRRPPLRGCQSDRCLSPRQEAGSPTFATSENWMGYSSPRGGARDSLPPQDFTPSGNFSTRHTRQCSGRRTESSIDRINRQDQQASAQDRSPSPGGGGYPRGMACSGGKRTNITKESDGMRRRLQLDPTQSDGAHRYERKHEFTEPTPNGQQSAPVRTPRVPPRMPQPLTSRTPTKHDSTGGSFRGNGTPGARPSVGGVDMQHRTSVEMAAAMSPEFDSAADERKYMVGSEVLSGNKTTRRVAAVCQQRLAHEGGNATPRQSGAAGGSKGGNATPRQSGAAGGSKAASMSNLRDHRNSDAVKENMTTPAQAVLPRRTYATALPVEVEVVAPSIPAGSQHTPAHHGGPMVSYGGTSNLPSTLMKESAFHAAGLKVVKHWTRSPGAFSPNAARVVAAQAMPETAAPSHSSAGGGFGNSSPRPALPVRTVPVNVTSPQAAPMVH